jgi:hypothetical protein
MAGDATLSETPQQKRAPARAAAESALRVLTSPFGHVVRLGPEPVVIDRDCSEQRDLAIGDEALSRQHPDGFCT